MKDENHNLNSITVAHLITELNVGGAERMLEKLLTGMDKKRFRFVVVSMTDIGPLGENIRGMKIPVFGLGMARGRPTLFGMIRLFKIFKKERIDVLQTWLYHADLLGLVVGTISGIRKIVWGIRCSDMEFANYRFLTRLIVKLNSKLSVLVRSIVVNSQAGKIVHGKMGYRTRRMVLIPNGFDTAKFYPDAEVKRRMTRKLGLDGESVLIGIIARWDPMKDHRNFLKAATILTEKDKSVHFLMAGKGIDSGNKEIVSLIKDGNLGGKVHLLGFRKDMQKIMASLDIAASSSAYGEGFPNTIGEAMACGVPCVVTDVGDSARIVDDTGIIVAPKNPEALAAAWKKLVDLGAEGRVRLGAAARKRVMDHFEISGIAREYEAFYDSLMAKTRC